MKFLKGLTEKVFGGTDNSAQKAQIQANQRSQAFIEEMGRLSRGDANYLIPAGDYARNASTNAAMAFLGNSMPTQMGMFQDGNVSAQMQLLAGMPQFQNAILGLPVDNQALQPVRLAMPDSSFYKQQLPDFGMAQAPPAGQPWGTPQQPAVPGSQVMAPPMQGVDTRALGLMLGGRY